MYRITDACTACDACVDACPIGAIAPGAPIYVIDPETCCDFESCLVMCPEDAIVFAEEAQAPRRYINTDAMPNRP